MKKVEKFKKIIKEHKEELNKKYSVSKIGLFGSYIKGLENEESDLDILIEFEKPISMFSFLRLENYLGELLNIKVDLVSKNSLKKHIGKKILGETIYV